MKNKVKKNTTVLAFGTFDVLHPGHLHYLKECKKRGSKLIVVIARDTTVCALKGRPPLFSENDRSAIVQSLKMVDSAVLGDPIHHCRIIEKVCPDIICLGYDQNVTSSKLALQLKRMHIPYSRIIRIGPLKPKTYKSSIYKQHILKRQSCILKRRTSKLIV